MSDRIPTLEESGRATGALASARIAYTDVDGTLLGRGGCLVCDLQGRPSLAAASAVAEINERGLPVVLTSGRTVPMLREISRMLGWRDFIAEMGCIRAYDRGAEVVHELGLWPPLVTAGGQSPHRIIESIGAIDALFEAFPGKLEYHSPHHHDREASHLLRGHVDAGEAQAVLDALPDAETLPLTFLDNGVINPPAHELEDVERVHAYHVMPRGCGKTEAILADLARRGLEPADAIMIGDSAADMDVRDAVGLVVLVENALRSPHVRARGPELANVVVTEGSAGEGWAQIARAWIQAAG